MSQGSLSPRLSWPGLEVGATHSRHGTAQTNPTCLCKGPGPSKGGFLGRLAGTHVITPPFPKFPFNIPPPRLFLRITIIKLSWGNQELCHGS